MTSGTAALSPCGTYRYELTRLWDSALPELLAVMLNPSTADAAIDDPTIRRLVSFAKRDGFGGLRVLNLYALRSVDPAALWAKDSVGPENDERLATALKAASRAPVLAAWGASRWAKRRAFKVLRLVPAARWVCLGTTRDGSPRHPLYVKGNQSMVPFRDGLALDEEATDGE